MQLKHIYASFPLLANQRLLTWSHPPDAEATALLSSSVGILKFNAKDGAFDAKYR